MKPETIIAGVVGALIFGLATWYEISLWNECRDAGHSIGYCLRTVVQ